MIVNAAGVRADLRVYNAMRRKEMVEAAKREIAKHRQSAKMTKRKTQDGGK